MRLLNAPIHLRAFAGGMTAGLVLLVALLGIVGCSSSLFKPVVGTWKLNPPSQWHDSRSATDWIPIITFTFRNDGTYVSLLQLTKYSEVDRQQGAFRIIGNRVYTIAPDGHQDELGELRDGRIYVRERYGPGTLMLTRVSQLP